MVMLINEEFTSGTSIVAVFRKVIMVWYIQMGHTNENTNFTHNIGLIMYMALGL